MLKEDEQVSMFSPHTRGCSGVKEGLANIGQVFPAYAGMFPALFHAWNALACFPRIRGDVPRTANSPQVNIKFSPHTRGCSLVDHG